MGAELVRAIFGATLTIFMMFPASSSFGQSQTELQENWSHCLSVFAETVAATTDEQAEVIANAAMSACQDQEDALAEFYKANGPVVAEFALTELLPMQKENYRQKTIAKVLAIKAAKRLQ